MLAPMKPVSLLIVLFLLLSGLPGCAGAPPADDLKMPPEFLGWWHPKADYIGIDIRQDGTMEERVESRDYKGAPLVATSRYKIFRIQDGYVYAIREMRFTDDDPHAGRQYNYIRMHIDDNIKYLPNHKTLYIHYKGCDLSKDNFENDPPSMHWKRLTDDMCKGAGNETGPYDWYYFIPYAGYKDKN